MSFIVPPPNASTPPEYTDEQEAWLANRDPYAPVLQPVLDAVGVGDPLGQVQAGQDAYTQGVPAPVPDDKGEAVAQDLVDLQHSGLGQAVGSAIDTLHPFGRTIRHSVNWNR